jgi:hypothetical protein
MKLEEIADRLPAFGFGLGAIAWGASTQLNYALVPKNCLSHWPMIPIFAAMLALIAAGGAAVSAVALYRRRAQPSPDIPQGGVPHKLLASIGLLAGALFTVVILLQGVAGLFLSGCE